jgi:phospholipid/cholesterol/gamma-HCH transport system ATP-binding protein
MTTEAAAKQTATSGDGILLKIVDVRKAFGSQQVLDGVNLEIPEGKITFIIGPSGTGKSVCSNISRGYKARLRPYLFGRRRYSRAFRLQNDGSAQADGVLFQSAALFDSSTSSTTWRFRWWSTRS